MPFPSEETTPPDTNTYLVIEEPGIGLADHSPIPLRSQRAPPREQRRMRAGARGNREERVSGQTPISTALIDSARISSVSRAL